MRLISSCCIQSVDESPTYCCIIFENSALLQSVSDRLCNVVIVGCNGAKESSVWRCLIHGYREPVRPLWSVLDRQDSDHHKTLERLTCVRNGGKCCDFVFVVLALVALNPSLLCFLWIQPPPWAFSCFCFAGVHDSDRSLSMRISRYGQG